MIRVVANDLASSAEAFTGGFTLIELLVVIAIIGYLTMIGLTSFQHVQTKSRDARRESDLSQIFLGLKLYYDDNDFFPLTESGTTDGSSGMPAGSIFSLSANPIYPGYITGVLTDPLNTPAQEYRYSVSADHQKFTLCTPLEADAGTWYNVYETGIKEQTPNCNLTRL